jgi:hypothetical protein
MAHVRLGGGSEEPWRTRSSLRSRLRMRIWVLFPRTSSGTVGDRYFVSDC